MIYFCRAKKNVSIVHIYFTSASNYAKVRKELYGITDLIGKIVFFLFSLHIFDNVDFIIIIDITTAIGSICKTQNSV